MDALCCGRVSASTPHVFQLLLINILGTMFQAVLLGFSGHFGTTVHQALIITFK